MNAIEPSALTLNRAGLFSLLQETHPAKAQGKVTGVCGPAITASLTGAAVGDLVKIVLRGPGPSLTADAEIVAFNGPAAILTPYASNLKILPGAEVQVTGAGPRLSAGPFLPGSLLDGLGRPAAGTKFAGSGVRTCVELLDFHAPPPRIDERRPIAEQLTTGIRSIDCFTAVGVGQRLAVFAEPGVGKSMLLSALASHAEADVVVIALIGERGREVAELAADLFGSAAGQRAVIVASTSSDPAPMRAQAALCATRIAEYFRDRGQNVLLLVDSLTRLVRAYREIGLAAGEVPVRRGYPPSVFEKLPQLLERAGMTARGSITALYTVLLSSDLDEDPMVEEIKGLTDGHIVLRREIAERGRYPALDISQSCSRVAAKVLPAEVNSAVRLLRAAFSRLEEQRETAMLSGAGPEILRRMEAYQQQADRFLCQDANERSSFDETSEALLSLLARYRELFEQE